MRVGDEAPEHGRDGYGFCGSHVRQGPAQLVVRVGGGAYQAFPLHLNSHPGHAAFERFQAAKWVEGVSIVLEFLMKGQGQSLSLVGVVEGADREGGPIRRGPLLQLP